MSTDNPREPDPITVARAAVRLGVDVTTVHRLIRGHALPATKLPGLRGAYLIRPADLDRYITERQQGEAS